MFRQYYNQSLFCVPVTDIPEAWNIHSSTRPMARCPLTRFYGFIAGARDNYSLYPSKGKARNLFVFLTLPPPRNRFLLYYPLFLRLGAHPCAALPSALLSLCPPVTLCARLDAASRLRVYRVAEVFSGVALLDSCHALLLSLVFVIGENCCLSFCLSRR